MSKLEDIKTHFICFSFTYKDCFCRSKLSAYIFQRIFIILGKGLQITYKLRYCQTKTFIASEQKCKVNLEHHKFDVFKLHY